MTKVRLTSSRPDFRRFEGTIAALATPPGAGGIGVIRISGPEALDVVRRLVPTLPETPRSHHLYLRAICSPTTGETLDRGLAVFMPGPGSFTGDDVAELHCHGGPVHMRAVLEAVISSGARPAEPGEFTRRAFLNGRLDLVQAEAVGDLIEARSEAACRLARRHLEGGLSRVIEAIRERLAEALTLLEAGIDFSLEEHVYAVDRADLGRRLLAADRILGRLLASYDDGQRVREGIRCVIAGRPNAGKSTLLNRLLDQDRAIVAPAPGTTRDWLDADLILDGQLFTLVDTAGLWEAGEAVEAEGVSRSRQQLRAADLVIYVVDATLSWSDDEARDVAAIEAPGILLWNKTDRAEAGSCPPSLPSGWRGPVAVSLHDDTGLDPLWRLLRQSAREHRDRTGGESATLTRARHRDALARGRDHLATARTALSEGLDEELAALDLRLALDAIGEVVGVVTPEDVLGRIFASFCIGK